MPFCQGEKRNILFIITIAVLVVWMAFLDIKRLINQSRQPFVVGKIDTDHPSVSDLSVLACKWLDSKQSARCWVKLKHAINNTAPHISQTQRCNYGQTRVRDSTILMYAWFHEDWKKKWGGSCMDCRVSTEARCPALLRLMELPVWRMK